MYVAPSLSSDPVSRITDCCAAVEMDTAPSGMLARGKYKAVSKFVDDDEQTHLQFEWSFEVKKDW